MTGELGSLARFLSAVSTRPDMVACWGCPVEFAKTIDQSEYFTQGVQSCFRFEHLSLARLMHKTSYSVFFCSNDDNLASFSLLSSSFGRSAFAEKYDPWTYVDTFGRSKIYKSLLASCRIASSVPEKVSVQIDSGDASSVADDSAVKAPSSKKRRKMERKAFRSSASSATVSPQSSVTKN